MLQDSVVQRCTVVVVTGYIHCIQCVRGDVTAYTVCVGNVDFTFRHVGGSRAMVDTDTGIVVADKQFSFSLSCLL